MGGNRNQGKGLNQDDVTTETGGETHVCDPTEDVGVEAHMVLRNVDSTLDENVPLQCAAIVCRRWYDFEIIVPHW